MHITDEFCVCNSILSTFSNKKYYLKFEGTFFFNLLFWLCDYLGKHFLWLTFICAFRILTKLKTNVSTPHTAGVILIRPHVLVLTQKSRTRKSWLVLVQALGLRAPENAMRLHVYISYFFFQNSDFNPNCSSLAYFLLSVGGWFVYFLSY